MNTSSETTKAAETSLARDWINFARYYVGRNLGGRRGLIILTVAALGVGVALNWSWLVAIGVAPLLVALAPCAAMCALGLCMSRMGGKSCSTQSSSTREEAGVQSSSGMPRIEIAPERLAAASGQTADAPADRRASDAEEVTEATRSRAMSKRS